MVSNTKRVKYLIIIIIVIHEKNNKSKYYATKTKREEKRRSDSCSTTEILRWEKERECVKYMYIFTRSDFFYKDSIRLLFSFSLVVFFNFVFKLIFISLCLFISACCSCYVAWNSLVSVCLPFCLSISSFFFLFYYLSLIEQQQQQNKSMRWIEKIYKEWNINEMRARPSKRWCNHIWASSCRLCSFY